MHHATRESPRHFKWVKCAAAKPEFLVRRTEAAMRFCISSAKLGRDSGVIAFLLLAMVGVAPAQDTGESSPLRDRQPDAPRRIVLRLTRDAFAPIVDRDVDEILPVNDTIVGTPV